MREKITFILEFGNLERDQSKFDTAKSGKCRENFTMLHGKAPRATVNISLEHR